MRGRKLIFTSHNGHCHAHLNRALETRSVRLTQHTGNPRSKRIELEIEFQMGKAVVWGNLIVVGSTLLLCYGHNTGGDLEAIGHFHSNAVGFLEASDLEIMRSPHTASA
eukprot:Gb_38735 [translate_table: standard]